MNELVKLIKSCLNSLAVLISHMQCEGKLFKRKSKAYPMSEKRHEINTFANYQNIMVKNSSSFDSLVFVLSSKPQPRRQGLLVF